MKIEFELNKPDYDRVTYHGLRVLLHVIVWGVLSWTPSAIAGELYYTYLVNRWDFPTMSWIIPLTMLFGLATIILFLILLTIIITIGEKIFKGGQLAINAYKRYDKKQWMEKRDNEGKCINCRHDHGAKRHFITCDCRDNKPLKFYKPVMRMVIGETITGGTSGVTSTYIGNSTVVTHPDGSITVIPKVDNRYCVECGKTFEIEQSNVSDMCTECASNKIESIEDRAITTPVNEGTRCLDTVTCKHNTNLYSCECGCMTGKSIFYQCQWREHQRVGKPHNSWISGVGDIKEPHECVEGYDCDVHTTKGWVCECDKCGGQERDGGFTYYCQLQAHRAIGRPHGSWGSPLPPMDYESMDLICGCEHRWGNHISVGNCNRCDCKYFTEQKEYLNCPGCGKSGIKLNSDEMICSSSLLVCNIYRWNKHTNEVTNRNG